MVFACERWQFYLEGNDVFLFNLPTLKNVVLFRVQIARFTNTYSVKLVSQIIENFVRKNALVNLSQEVMKKLLWLRKVRLMCANNTAKFFAHVSFSAKSKLFAKILQYMNKGPIWVTIMNKLWEKNVVTLSYKVKTWSFVTF